MTTTIQKTIEKFNMTLRHVEEIPEVDVPLERLTSPQCIAIDQIHRGLTREMRAQLPWELSRNSAYFAAVTPVVQSCRNLTEQKPKNADLAVIFDSVVSCHDHMQTLCPSEVLTAEDHHRLLTLHQRIIDILTERLSRLYAANLDDLIGGLPNIHPGTADLSEIVHKIDAIHEHTKILPRLIRTLFPHFGHRSSEELTQSKVAKDLGVRRQTIILWERTQTEDGPRNKSNKYGYYRSLRTNSRLRNSYYTLVSCVQHYLRERAKAIRSGQRFIPFVRYSEVWMKHNPCR